MVAAAALFGGFCVSVSFLSGIKGAWPASTLLLITGIVLLRVGGVL